MEKFHVRLKAIRTQKKRTQTQTAEIVGVKLRAYQFYEEGKTEPSLEKLIKLADYFDVTLDYLMGRTDF